MCLLWCLRSAWGGGGGVVVVLLVLPLVCEYLVLSCPWLAVMLLVLPLSYDCLVSPYMWWSSAVLQSHWLPTCHLYQSGGSRHLPVLTDPSSVPSPGHSSLEGCGDHYSVHTSVHLHVFILVTAVVAWCPIYMGGGGYNGFFLHEGAWIFPGCLCWLSAFPVLTSCVPIMMTV